ncbi:MAG: hypothetical protein RJB39_245 [Candidatus Parcubacteria bacterium]|jgi:predicted Rossmann fold flavoprotein
MKTNSSTQELIERNWDLVIIGGGPAGMMAAYTAKLKNKKATVLVLEKNSTLGKKLLITGGGRCNVTNSEFDTRKFLANYKDSDKFLFSAFAQYGVKETLDFFHDNKMPTKVENEGRTFPISDSARSVWNVLVHGMEKIGVQVLSEADVQELAVSGNEDSLTHIEGVKVKVGGKQIETITAKEYIIATGGTSHPETGSTGDAYPWLRTIGHNVAVPKPVLVPLTIKEKWVKDLQGLTIQNIKLSVVVEKEKISSKKGKILFTHFGITGPTILNMSKQVSDLVAEKKKVAVHLDLLPHLDHGQLNQQLQDIFAAHKAKKIKNTLDEILPKAIAPTVLQTAGVVDDTVCSQVTREQRMVLIEVIKNMPMTVSGLLGDDKAIIASGGVPLKEIDFKTMRSRLCDNVFIVGDLLDIDRPSGGYSLQLCWTTGYVAGTHSV